MENKMKNVLIVLILIVAGFLVFFLPAGNVAGEDADLYISTTGSTYATIQDAIDAAESGDTIYVEAGQTWGALDITGVGDFERLTIEFNISATHVPNIIDAGAGICVDIDGLHFAQLDLVNVELVTTGGTQAQFTNNAEIWFDNVTFDSAELVFLDESSALRTKGTVTVEVLYFDDTPVEDAWLNYTISSDGQVAWFDPSYRTDASGLCDILTVNASYNQTVPTGIWGDHEVIINKTVNSSQTMILVLDVNDTDVQTIRFDEDIWFPEPVAVTVTADGAFALDVAWTACTDDAFTNYTVYQVDDDLGANPVMLIENHTTNAYAVENLDFNTTYFFYVDTFLDNRSRFSTSEIANGTTDLATAGTVSGAITFEAMTRGLLNATVELWNATEKIDTVDIDNVTNTYVFEDVVFQTNLSVMAIPEAAILSNGINESGWLPDESAEFELNLSHLAQVVDFTLDYFDCIPPLPVIIGAVKYAGGDLDGDNATEVTVTLINSTDDIVNTTATNETTGNYTFGNIPVDVNYTIMVEPAGALAGEMEVKSGYMPFTTAAFDVAADLSKDLVMTYYVFIPDLNGTVTYDQGGNATNATVELYQIVGVFNATLDETVNETKLVDETSADNVTGAYQFVDVPVGTSYFIMVTSVDEPVYVEKTTSGYLEYDGDLFDVAANIIGKDIVLVWKDFVEPEPDKFVVSGIITYSGGDLDTEAASGATVTIADTLTATTNATGGFTIADLIAGTGYNFTVTPEASVAGETGVKSGYMPYTGTIDVTADMTKDIALEYYTYIPPVVTYNITIGPVKDGDGDAVEGAKVTAKADGSTYIGTTGADGMVTFTNCPWAAFPAGTTFTATHTDFNEDIAWTQGEQIPTFKADEGKDNTMLIVGIIIVIVIVVTIIVVIVVFLVKKKPEEEEEEE